jgi:hypothetical protein
MDKIILTAAIISVLGIGCSKKDENGKKHSNNPTNGLAFKISDARNLFLGPAAGASLNLLSSNKILRKTTKSDAVEDAVTGFDGSFRLDTLLRNPVTDEVLILGEMTDIIEDKVFEYKIMRIDTNDRHYGLKVDDSLVTTDTWGNAFDRPFDGTGAYYFSTLPGDPNGLSKCWKYKDGTATSFAQGTLSSGPVNGCQIAKVFPNGYVIYKTDTGTWLRNPSGSLKAWTGGESGAYSEAKNMFYYSDKMYSFADGTTTSSNATVPINSKYFDLSDGSFVTPTPAMPGTGGDPVTTPCLKKFTPGSDGTLTAVSYLANWSFETMLLDGTKLYFKGTDASGNKNIFVYDLANTGTDPVGLLQGDDVGLYVFGAVSFGAGGVVSAVAQRLADGTYGSVAGSLADGTYEFRADDAFTSVTDILISE